MLVGIIIGLFVLNLFSLIAVFMLDKWNRETDEELDTLSWNFACEIDRVNKKFEEERNSLLRLIHSSERKSERVCDFIVDSMPKQQVSLFHAYRKRYENNLKGDDVSKRLEKLKFAYGYEYIERKSLSLLKQELNKKYRELQSEIDELEKEINK